jgi:hypothetical protein
MQWDTGLIDIAIIEKHLIEDIHRWSDQKNPLHYGVVVEVKYQDKPYPDGPRPRWYIEVWVKREEDITADLIIQAILSRGLTYYSSWAVAQRAQEVKPAGQSPEKKKERQPPAVGGNRRTLKEQKL